MLPVFHHSLTTSSPSIILFSTNHFLLIYPLFYTRTNYNLSPWVGKTCSPLHYHSKCLLRPLSSSRVTFPKPVGMNLNTACLWSQSHNAYFSEISSAFSTTLWSLSRSKAQKLLLELKIEQVKQRTGKVYNHLWVTQHSVISLLFMF